MVFPQSVPPILNHKYLVYVRFFVTVFRREYNRRPSVFWHCNSLVVSNRCVVHSTNRQRDPLFFGHIERIAGSICPMVDTAEVWVGRVVERTVFIQVERTVDLEGTQRVAFREHIQQINA